MECEKETKIDRLSRLPSEVLDLILVILPLKDAIRTSILSKEWRYKWGSLSQFEFDIYCLPYDIKNEASWGNIRKIVYQYLLLHNDAIDKFSLRAHWEEDYCDLYQWIYFLSKKGVKEFILEQYGCWLLELPSSLFAFQQLRHLQLTNCYIEVPHAFKELSSLASLHLVDVCIEDDTLETLIFNCPVLEKLILIKINELENLKIHGPNLKYFELCSNFKNISFRNTQRLASVDLKIILMYFGEEETIGQEITGQEKACNLLTALGSLPGLERLTLLTHFFMYLDINDASKRLRNPFNNVITVDLLDIHLNDAEMVKTTISVLQMFPNLKELNFSVKCYNIVELIVKFLNGQEQVNFSFKKLQAVGMEDILDNIGVACQFLKLIIRYSPMLETVTIKKDGKMKHSENKLRKMFHHLKGSSALVKVMYQATEPPKSYIF